MLGRRVGKDGRRCNERRRRAEIDDRTASGASILRLCGDGSRLLGPHGDRDLARHKEHTCGIDVKKAFEFSQGKVSDVDTLLNSDLIEEQPVSNQYTSLSTSKSSRQHS